MLFTEPKYADDYRDTTKSQKELLKQLVAIARKGNYRLPKIKKPRTKGEYMIAIQRCAQALHSQGGLPPEMDEAFTRRERFTQRSTRAKVEQNNVGNGFTFDMYKEHENERYGIINPSPWTIAIREAQKKA